MTFQFTPHVLPLFFSATILGLVGAFAWRNRTKQSAFAFLVAILMLLVWTVGFALEIAGVSLADKIFWANVQFAGIALLPPAWLVMVIQYTGQARKTLKYVPFMGILPLVTNIVIWTDAGHHFFRGNPYVDISAGPFPILVNDYQWWFYWVNTPYGYSIFAGTLILLLRSLLYTSKIHRSQISILTAGMVAPLLVDALYIVGITPIPNFNFTPVAFSLSGLLIAWALFQFRLFDITPLARGAVIENMSEGVVVLDSRNRVIDFNPAAQTITGIEISQALGHPVEEVFCAWPELVLQVSSVSQAHVEIGIGDGVKRRHYDFRISPIQGERGQQVGRAFILYDVTERVRLFDEVKKAAREDGLTRVLTRRYFIELAQQEWKKARRYTRPLSLILFDIDHFKQVNDKYGHQVGDMVLVAIAKRCQECVRNVDLLGRFGGEEFVVLIPETALNGASQVAARLREEVAALKVNTEHGTVQITASFGVAEISPALSSLDELIKLADDALYKAKDAGRNRVVAAGE